MILYNVGSFSKSGKVPVLLNLNHSAILTILFHISGWHYQHNNIHKQAEAGIVKITLTLCL